MRWSTSETRFTPITIVPRSLRGIRGGGGLGLGGGLGGGGRLGRSIGDLGLGSPQRGGDQGGDLRHDAVGPGAAPSPRVHERLDLPVAPVQLVPPEKERLEHCLAAVVSTSTSAVTL